MKHILLAGWLLLGGISLQAGDGLITLEDMFGARKYNLQTVPGFHGMKNGKQFSRLVREEVRTRIALFDLASGKERKTLWDSEKHRWEGTVIPISSYSFSSDEDWLVLRSETEPIYRRSSKSRIYVMDLETQNLQSLGEEKVLHPEISPDGQRMAFVFENNLYVQDLRTGKRDTITRDGEWNAIINGNCDWVYEEEFQFSQAYQWSPDGRYLAYYRFDESEIPIYQLHYYEQTHPRVYEYKYPKAGDPVSRVEIHVHQLSTGETRRMDLGEETNQYVPRIKWTPDQGLVIYRLNRLQNHLELLLADPATGNTRIIYEEKNPYYISIDDNLDFPEGKSRLLITSEKGGYNQLYLWDWETKTERQLTKGNYDIDQLLGYDARTGLVYFTAGIEDHRQRQLYSLELRSGKIKAITSEPGTHDVQPVQGFRYFLDRYSQLNQVPRYYLRNAKGKIVRVLEDNSELEAAMDSLRLGSLRFEDFPIRKDLVLKGWMIRPPDFDSSRKYPVLVYQYSGPGYQDVRDRFPIRDYFWHQMLAQKGYIIVCADGRGTGFRGEAFKKQTYLKLGKLETEDQIDLARFLAEKDYVDSDRIGIWGWSYGGYISSSALLRGPEWFRMAIAVAPVTNWRYYDNIYTERYMRTPEENPEGYDEQAPEHMAENLKGALLLVHGSGDDNVHVQHSYMLANALIKANKPFDMEIYPNRHHGISGGKTRWHLYERMTAFILENL